MPSGIKENGQNNNYAFSQREEEWDTPLPPSSSFFCLLTADLSVAELREIGIFRREIHEFPSVVFPAATCHYGIFLFTVGNMKLTTIRLTGNAGIFGYVPSLEVIPFQFPVKKRQIGIIDIETISAEFAWR